MINSGDLRTWVYLSRAADALTWIIAFVGGKAVQICTVDGKKTEEESLPNPREATLDNIKN